MRDLVLITTYNRPEYLRLCLEYLSKARGINNKIIWICIDRGNSLIREFYEVLNDFRELDFSVKVRPEHSYLGNTFNTLEAYKEAYKTDANLVYLVEDDVLVTPDFFEWHEEVQNKNDLICSVAYRCSRNSNRLRSYEHDPEAYFISSKDYASIGVCWKREKLDYITTHANSEYYKDLVGYLKKHFPNNKFSSCFTEQDGLVMRLLGETHGYVAWPFVPRAYHFGVWGYNRPRGSRLSYQEIKEMIHNEQKIKMVDKDFGDIEPMPIEPIPAWTKLNCVQRID